MAQPSPAWTDADLSRDPHAAADKARRVRDMFAAIAPSYDLNNRLHSLWRDQAWRRAAVRFAKLAPGDTVVDAACGTGDLTFAFRNGLDRLIRNGGSDAASSGGGLALGLDFTHEMLRIAEAKGRDRPRRAKDSPARLPGAVAFAAADAMRLPLPDACCDVVSIAFGIRNVAGPGAAVGEFHRVLRPGGRLVILEFSQPRNPLLRGLYQFYFRHVLPRTATLIARDRSGAYKYLPRSVDTFLDRDALQALMRDAGFSDVRSRPLTFGIAHLHRGTK